MEITWLGRSCFRLRGREGVVVIDPYDKSVTGRPLAKLTADILLVSHDHPGHNATGAVGGEPRILNGPGEYEIKGIPIVGVQTAHDGEHGKKRGRNVAWLVEIDDIHVCHLGDLGHTLTEEQAEALGSVDILLTPVGGHNTINAVQANEIVTTIEPKIVVPMHYADADEGNDSLDGVDAFLRVQGVTRPEPQAKLSVTATNLPSDTQVVLLDSRRA